MTRRNESVAVGGRYPARRHRELTRWERRMRADGRSRPLTIRRVGETAWRTATSMRTAIALMLGLGLLGLFGAVIRQAPSGATGPAYAEWVESVTPVYGTWTSTLDALGLFGVFSSIWFRLALGGLVASILACSVKRSRAIARAAFDPPRTVSAAFFRTAANTSEWSASMEPGEAVDLVRETLRRRGYRALVTERDDATQVFGDRFRFAPFGSLLAHISLLTILVGALVGSLWGFRNPEFVVSVGSTVDVGFGTGFAVEAVDFTDSYYMDGSPSDYASDLVLFENGARVANQHVRVNEPLRHGDLSIYQSFFGPAILVTAAKDGRTLFEGGVPLVWTSRDGLHSIGEFALEGAGMTFYVGSAASGKVDPLLKAGQVQVEAYGTADQTAPLDSAVLSQGAAAKVAGIDITFVRERQYTGLIVSRDPGLPLIWTGAALLVAGISVVFLFRPRRVWARIERTPQGTRIALATVATREPSARRNFQELTSDVHASLSLRDQERR